MIKRSHSNARMSQLVEFSGSMVVTAGIVSDDPTLDVVGQTKNILDKIDGFLAEAGTDKTKALWAYVWLADISDFAAMNSVYDKWVPTNAGPARACVEAKLADPRLKVEIQVFAVK